MGRSLKDSRQRAEVTICPQAADFELLRPPVLDPFDASQHSTLLDRATALRAVHRLLKPGGLFMSKTMALAEMGFPIRLLVPVMQAFGQAPHVSFFTTEELESEIASAGFEIVERAKLGSGKKDVRPFLVARKI